jgi:hypothetical protein
MSNFFEVKEKPSQLKFLNLIFCTNYLRYKYDLSFIDFIEFWDIFITENRTVGYYPDSEIKKGQMFDFFEVNHSTIAQYGEEHIYIKFLKLIWQEFSDSIEKHSCISANGEENFVYFIRFYIEYKVTFIGGFKNGDPK